MTETEKPKLHDVVVTMRKGDKCCRRCANFCFNNTAEQYSTCPPKCADEVVEDEGILPTDVSFFNILMLINPNYKNDKFQASKILSGTCMTNDIAYNDKSGEPLNKNPERFKYAYKLRGCPCYEGIDVITGVGIGVEEGLVTI
jgi:hypothetical protein